MSHHARIHVWGRAAARGCTHVFTAMCWRVNRRRCRYAGATHAVAPPPDNDESHAYTHDPQPTLGARPLAAVVGIGLLGLLGAAIVRAQDALVVNPGSGIDTAQASGNNDANIQQLAANLYGDHVFAFQLTSVLLIVAVVGTVLLTRKWPRNIPTSESSDA